MKRKEKKAAKLKKKKKSDRGFEPGPKAYPARRLIHYAT